jgi:calcineurin-like phosphoesterase family protein
MTNDTKIYITSDTHFGHENSLRWTDSDGQLIRGRVFQSVQEMNDCILTNWNEVVRPHDIVYHLGDVYWKGKTGGGAECLPKLHGRKRLVLGNHDNGKDQLLQQTFQKISAWRMFSEFDVVLSHVPLMIPTDGRFKYNIHGHTHQQPDCDYKHLNVSVERWGYAPINLEYLVSELKKKELMRDWTD